jgi:5-methylcytosine-specific restriction endonuclease McrA
MMIDVLRSAAALDDARLLSDLEALAGKERDATAHLIAVLAEVDARRLYLGQGCSSLFTYCTQVLHLSEHAAYGRIEAARVGRKFPLVLDLLADGSVNLTIVCLLGPQLTGENHATLLADARHKSKREIEGLIARLRPQPPVPTTIRKVPAPRLAQAPIETRVKTEDHSTGIAVSTPPAPKSEVKPLAPEYYKVQFTASRETFDKLRLAQDLMRHRIPNGDVAAVVDRALSLLIAELQKTKCAATAHPRAAAAADSPSRHIAAAVRREVWARDGGQCAFIGAAGRWTERGFLEFHHVVPYAENGGKTPSNIQLRCRAHNTYEAERWFGSSDDWMVRETASRHVGVCCDDTAAARAGIVDANADCDFKPPARTIRAATMPSTAKKTCNAPAARASSPQTFARKWTRIARTRLAPVRRYSAVSNIEIATTPTVNNEKEICVCGILGMKNSGRCHTAYRAVAAIPARLTE